MFKDSEPGSGSGGSKGLRGAALENYANNFSPLEAKTRSDLRKRRYFRRADLWAESSLERVRKCGRVGVTPLGMVAVRVRDGVAGFAGLASCGSVWADPVCSAKIMSRRALEIGCAVESWQALGGHVGLFTFTMRHRKGQRLGWLWDRLGKSWNRVTGGKGWMLDKGRYGVAGWMRVIEVNYGANGWHVHIHALVFFEPGLIAPDVAGVHASMFGRWERALVRLGAGKPLMLGQDAKILSGAADEDLARYFTKAVYGARGIGLEVTGAQSKRARTAHGTYPVWWLLDLAFVDGDAEALGLWQEYERASKGRRNMTWSKGLRDRLALGEEASDEDVAAEELGSNDDDLVIITAAGWRAVVEVLAMARLLDAAEVGGMSAVVAVLNEIGAEYMTIGEAA